MRMLHRGGCGKHFRKTTDGRTDLRGSNVVGLFECTLVSVAIVLGEKEDGNKETKGKQRGWKGTSGLETPGRLR